MARVALTAAAITQLPKAQRLNVAAGSALMGAEAADATDFNSVPCTGKEILIAENKDTGAQTVIVHAAPDQIERTGQITPAYSIPPNGVAILGPFPVAGYKQADDQLWIDASNAAVVLSIVRFP